MSPEMLADIAGTELTKPSRPGQTEHPRSHGVDGSVTESPRLRSSGLLWPRSCATSSFVAIHLARSESIRFGMIRLPGGSPVETGLEHVGTQCEPCDLLGTNGSGGIWPHCGSCRASKT